MCNIFFTQKIRQNLNLLLDIQSGKVIKHLLSHFKLQCPVNKQVSKLLGVIVLITTLVLNNTGKGRHQISKVQCRMKKKNLIHIVFSLTPFLIIIKFWKTCLTYKGIYIK